MRTQVRLLNSITVAAGLAVALCITVTTVAFSAAGASGSNEPGSDRTKHGCIGSAGYTWSQVRNECIRLFEAGVPLYNTRDPDATSVAYVVSGGDQMPLELFLPDNGNGILMFYRDGAWHDDDGRYELTNDKNDVLDVRNSSGALLYSSLKPKS